MQTNTCFYLMMNVSEKHKRKSIYTWQRDVACLRHRFDVHFMEHAIILVNITRFLYPRFDFVFI